MDEGTCTVEDCGAPKHGRVYCVNHYRRWKKYGDPLGVAPVLPKPPVPMCSIEGCDRPAFNVRGWCQRHYGRWRKHGDPLAGRLSADAKPEACTVEGCEEPTRSKGLCMSHYYRERRHGDATAGRTPLGEPLEFYRANLGRATDECILWPYTHSPYGHGQLWIDGRYALVHDLACEWAHGPRPSPDHVASHGACHTPACWNPRHIQWQTRKQDAADRRRDGTHHEGEQIVQAKLTEADVRSIRQRRERGESLEGLAREYGIHPEHAGLIARRQKVWQHVI